MTVEQPAGKVATRTEVRRITLRVVLRAVPATLTGVIGLPTLASASVTTIGRIKYLIHHKTGG